MKETLFPTSVLGEISLKSLENGVCQRCFSGCNSHLEDYDGRTICSDCIQFGISTSHNLIFRHPRRLNSIIHTMVFDFELSLDQKRGSAFFVDCCENFRSGFLEAVCGAGKTEMLYHGILNTLNKGMKICFAIPRKQIVIEIEKRLKSVFPSTTIKAIHGDSKEDSYAEIIISTIHQLIHYYQEFDLLIIDEVDAYPLLGSPMLHRLIHKAIKPSSILFLMSATTYPEISRYIDEFHMNQCVIYTRFHQVPQDIPKMLHVKRLNSTIMKGLIPKTIESTITHWVNEGSIVFVYVPTINLGIQVFAAFGKRLDCVDMISSKTKFKESILRKVENSETKILITTSILERGVTFSQLNVMILFSDHKIFSKEMLIQIAGRVGRKSDHPKGEILFVSEYVSDAMLDAIQRIEQTNQWGEFSK